MHNFNAKGHPATRFKLINIRLPAMLSNAEEYLKIVSFYRKCELFLVKDDDDQQLS